MPLTASRHVRARNKFPAYFRDRMESVTKRRSRSIKKWAGMLSLTGGLVLVAINIIGFYNYTTIQNNNPHLLDDRPRTVSEMEFWNRALKKTGESDYQYVKRLTALVSDRMLLIDPAYAKPTLFENWILWIIARCSGRHQWIDTRKAVRLGGGFCSQHAIVFNNILRRQGFNARIVSLHGHVINEVFLNGEWKTFDPDYNVIFNVSLKRLENQPEIVFRAYRAAGRPEREAQHWVEVFASDEDNRHFKTSMDYEPIDYFIEKASFFLIWIIPVIMVFTGVLLKKKA